MKLSPALSVGCVLALSAVALAGCAPAPPENQAAQSDYCARMVTDTGGITDRSFNEASWAGLKKAQEQYGIRTRAIISKAETDLAPNVQQAVESDCNLVLTVGFSLGDATLAAAIRNPGTHFAIVDDLVLAPNVKPLLFDTAQAAFLAGYLAAGVTKTGTVATFGGANQPPVTIFMDGFVDGVAHYNSVHGTDVHALGWDKAKQDGVFTGNFADVNRGSALAEGFLDQGADIVMPVAGHAGEGAGSAVAAHPGALLVWVDSDGYNTLPESVRPLVLTSVMKNTTDAVVEIVGDDIVGKFTSTPYVGTLNNAGVGLAPFHDQAAAVSPDLAAEIDALGTAIMTGKLTVTSPSAPK